MRLIITLVGLGLAFSSRAHSIQLVDAPEPTASVLSAGKTAANLSPVPASANPEASPEASPETNFDSPAEAIQAPKTPSKPDTNHGDPQTLPSRDVELDAAGNPIPIERQQPKRILGFMPNFRSVSGGAKPHPPGWKYNFKIATRQATDYSSFIFLGITSLSAEGINAHPVLGKGVGGLWAYTWRGFLDKTDGSYLSAWLMPSLLHEDTRFYAMGAGHPIPIRALYVISRQGVARTYGGRQTPNIAGLGGKILTQIVSRTYYPTGATSFSVLATKFAYSAMRDIAFTSIREFYPDAAAHFIRKHREKMARIAEQSKTPVH